MDISRMLLVRSKVNVSVNDLLPAYLALKKVKTPCPPSLKDDAAEDGGIIGIIWDYTGVGWRWMEVFIQQVFQAELPTVSMNVGGLDPSP